MQQKDLQDFVCCLGSGADRPPSSFNAENSHVLQSF